MGMPQLVVTAVLVEGRTKSEVARDYGVSRRWVITLVQRYPGRGRGRAAAALTPAAAQPSAAPPTRSRTRSSRSARTSTGTATRPARPPSPPTCSAATAPHPRSRTIWRILTARGLRHPAAAQAPQEQLRPLRGRPTQRTLADRHHPLGPGRRHRRRDPQLARRPLPATAWPAPPAAVFNAPDVDAGYRQSPPDTAIPAAVLTDNGAVFTGRYRGRGRVALELTLHARGVVFTPLPALPPADLRQGRTLPPDPEEVARHPAPAPHRAPPPAPARHLPRLLQHRPAAPRPARRTPQQAYAARPKAAPAGIPLDRRPLPGPPRQDRHQRQAHPAPQQPAAPHRHRPPPRRHNRARPGPRPAHPGHHAPADDYSETSTSTRPGTTNHSPKRERCPETPVNGVPRHRSGVRGGT